ncbi:MAG: dUTP diphosphatase [Alphaproteobacteria bacterium]|nr:dUTP diphosphatase [Alphaproteobacteria bacterium]
MNFNTKPSEQAPRNASESVGIITDLPVKIVLRTGTKMPFYALDDCSGVDLCAALDQSVALSVGQRYLVPTGLLMSIPAGYEAQIRSRSGLALNHGIMVLNSPGTIDAGYRGEIKVLLINLGQEPFVIEPCARIAQCVFAPIARVHFQVCQDLETSDRGDAGFGSTGMH